MCGSGFGERLKRERELRGVSREEVCTATRITARYLEALENERWESLPGGVFNRGFVRAVARFLGLDEDDLLAEYDAAMNDQKSESTASTTARVQVPVQKKRRPFVWVAAVCTVCLLLITVWFTWKWDVKFTQARGTDAASPTHVAVATQLAAGSTPGEAVVATGSLSPPSGNPAERQSPALELKVEAGKETSMTVSADGTKVFEGSIIAGQSRTFTAQAAIDISAKDAGALLLELNGQTLAPLGPPGQPGNATLTLDDLKPTGGGAD
jgi:cytoskeletal protein RodZ